MIGQIEYYRTVKLFHINLFSQNLSNQNVIYSLFIAIQKEEHNPSVESWQANELVSNGWEKEHTKVKIVMTDSFKIDVTR